MDGVLENLLPVSGESKFLSSWLGLRSARRCLAGNWATSSMLSRELGVSSVVPRDEEKLDADIRASGIRSLRNTMDKVISILGTHSTCTFYSFNQLTWYLLSIY